MPSAMLAQSVLSRPTCLTNPGWRMSWAGCWRAPQKTSERPEAWISSARRSRAWRPVGVDGGGVAQANDDYGGQRGELLTDFVELLRAAEEEGAVDAEDGDKVGDELALEHMHLVACDVPPR